MRPRLLFDYTDYAILKTLIENGSMRVRELYQQAVSKFHIVFETFELRLRRLNKAGFVTIQKEGNIRIVSITEKGRDMIDLIDTLLSSE